MTQTEAVLKYMKEHNGITTRQAWDDLRITRLSARIYDLRALGYRIESEFVLVNTRKYGKTHVCRYYLV